MIDWDFECVEGSVDIDVRNGLVAIGADDASEANPAICKPTTARRIAKALLEAADEASITDGRLLELFKEYWALAYKKSVRSMVYAPMLDRVARFCNEGTDHVHAGNRDEAMRVLGFVQGFFSAHGILGPGDIDRHMGAA